MSAPHPLVIGHRGAPGYRPEHSRSSYELAIAMGVDAVEPDIVVSKDGVLVVRHESEIGATTDVADHPEFTGRRTTKRVEGTERTGWFVEDFTGDELATLRCRERLPAVRPASALFDDTEPVLRLGDLLDLVRDASLARGREIGVVLEIKHATYFGSLGWNVAALVAAELETAGWGDGGRPIVFESFESTVLAQLRARGIPGTYVYLLEATGRPVDLVASMGDAAPTYAEIASATGLDRLVGVVDGVSVDKRMILGSALRGANGPTAIVADAHSRGLIVFAWTCRPENTFLLPRFRSGGAPAEFGDYEGEWAIIRESGVDGVFVDHADLGATFFRGGRA